jgi:hypothetical protein
MCLCRYVSVNTCPKRPSPSAAKQLQMELASILVLLAAVQNSRQAGRRIAGRLSGTETLFPTSPQSALSAASTITCTVSAGFGALSARDRSSYCFFKPLKALSRGVSRGQVCGFKVCYRTYCTVPTLSVALSPGTVICCNLVTRHSAANAR